jgi:hypothetical protein
LPVTTVAGLVVELPVAGAVVELPVAGALPGPSVKEAIAARTAMTSRDPLMSLRVIARRQQPAEAVFVVDAAQAGWRDAVCDVAASIRFKRRCRGSR